MMGIGGGGGGGERAPLTTQDGRARTDRRGLPLDGIDGNWKCEQCSNVNFGSRDKCNRCGTMKGGGMGGNVKEMALRLVSVLALISLPSPCASAPAGSRACSRRACCTCRRPALPPPEARG